MYSPTSFQYRYTAIVINSLLNIYYISDVPYTSNIDREELFMSLSEQLCKFVEKRFKYLNDIWYFEHVETTLGEIFDSKELSGDLSADKEVDTFTYFSMTLDDEHVYPFIVQDDDQIIAMGYVEEEEVKLIYLTDGKSIFIDELHLLDTNKESVQNETVG